MDLVQRPPDLTTFSFFYFALTSLAMITGIAHVNLVVPPGTLDHAKDFYGRTLGFHPVSPPAIMQDVLAWWVNKRLIPIRGIAFTTGRTSPWGIELTHGIIGSI